MIRHCCSLKFYEINSYLKHLKFHKDNSSLQVECNECGHSSKTWDAFKKHIKIEHTKNWLYFFNSNFFTKISFFNKNMIFQIINSFNKFNNINL